MIEVRSLAMDFIIEFKQREDDTVYFLFSLHDQLLDTFLAIFSK